eukprot:18814_1
MLSFVIYVFTSLPNRREMIKSLLLFVCILCELSVLYWWMDDTELFQTIIKFLVILCLLLPLEHFPSNKCITFNGCFEDSYKASQQHRYYTKLKAYSNFEKYLKQRECSICLDLLYLKPKLMLLRCGHLFHRLCIKENEKHVWNQNTENSNSNINCPRFPFSRCPLCRTCYHSKSETFKYNKTRASRYRMLHANQYKPTRYLSLNQL